MSLPKWYDLERAFDERMRMVRFVEHVIQAGEDSKYSGRTEWRVYYLGYLDGQALFFGDSEECPPFSTSWYSVSEHEWMWQYNEAEPVDNFWWTLDPDLAQKYIDTYHPKVEII